MVFLSENLDITAKTVNSTNYLYFKFKGKFTEDISQQACRAWLEFFKQTAKSYTLVWDCMQMEGYELGARNEWVNALKEGKQQINKITVISDSMIIRGAARLMLKLFSFEAEVFKTAINTPWR